MEQQDQIEELSTEEIYTLYAYPEMQAFIKVLTAKRKLLLEGAPYASLTSDQWAHTRGRLQVMDDIIHYRTYTEMVEAQKAQEGQDVDPV